MNMKIRCYNVNCPVEEYSVNPENTGHQQTICPYCHSHTFICDELDVYAKPTYQYVGAKLQPIKTRIPDTGNCVMDCLSLLLNMEKEKFFELVDQTCGGTRMWTPEETSFLLFSLGIPNWVCVNNNETAKTISRNNKYAHFLVFRENHCVLLVRHYVVVHDIHLFKWREQFEDFGDYRWRVFDPAKPEVFCTKQSVVDFPQTKYIEQAESIIVIRSQ